MKLLLTHKSSLEYLRLHGAEQERTHFRVVKHARKVPAGKTGVPAVQESDTNGLTLPLSVTVRTADDRRPSRFVTPHVFSGVLPGGSIIDVGKGLLVGSPELVFLQMAKSLSEVKLIELGFELCGSYSMFGNERHRAAYNQSRRHDATPAGFYSRPPLTSKEKLAAFIVRMPGLPGSKKARRALRYIANGSASPMETILTMLLTLPYRLGGYSLPMPLLNQRVTLTKAAQQSLNRQFLRCDLLWPGSNVAVEYDSNAFHTGSDRITADSKRRNTLIINGITILTVTSDHVHSITELDDTARQVASGIGWQIQTRRIPGFRDAQRRLRKLLLA